MHLILSLNTICHSLTSIPSDRTTAPQSNGHETPAHFLMAMDSLRRLAFTPLLLGIHAAHLIALQVSAATSGGSRIASSSSRNVQRRPRHVAFSIVTSHGREAASSREPNGDGRSTVTYRTTISRKGKEKAEDVRWTTAEALVLQTVREAVTWALQNEVDEISLWNEDGERPVRVDI